MKSNKNFLFFVFTLFIFSVSVVSREEDEDFAFDPVITCDIDKAVKDEGSIYFNGLIESKQIIDELGFGWNLGNTFDAWNSSQNQGLDSETSWGNPKTTIDMIDALVAKGFKAIKFQ